MTQSRTLRCAAILGLALLCLGTVGTALASPVTYQVTVDTASASNPPAFVNFAYTGGPTATPATATISNFSGGTLSPASPAVNGLSLSNQPQGVGTSQLYSIVPSGSKISFNVTFNGPELLNPAVGDNSAFDFQLADASSNPLTQPPLLFPSAPDGGFTAIEIDTGNLGGGGLTSVTSFGAAAAASVIPEPASIVLLAVGLVGLGAFPYLRRRRPVAA